MKLVHHLDQQAKQPAGARRAVQGTSKCFETTGLSGSQLSHTSSSKARMNHGLLPVSYTHLTLPTICSV
eukprot:9292394-Prorocentrum_lima.AAC.1